jgi:hypothetical protein
VAVAVSADIASSLADVGDVPSVVVDAASVCDVRSPSLDVETFSSFTVSDVDVAVASASVDVVSDDGIAESLVASVDDELEIVDVVSSLAMSVVSSDALHIALPSMIAVADSLQVGPLTSSIGDVVSDVGSSRLIISSGSTAQVSQNPGVPRSATPSLNPRDVVAVNQPSLASPVDVGDVRIIVANGDPDVPANGDPPFPARSMVIPVASRSSIPSAEFERETVVVATVIANETADLGSLSA